MTKKVAGRRRNLRDRSGWRLHFGSEFLEWTVKGLENTIKFHAHLIRERPAGAVIRRCGRCARVFEIIRVILRFKHVQNMWAERLRGFYNVGAGGVAFSADRERRGCAVNRDAVLD